MAATGVMGGGAGVGQHLAAAVRLLNGTVGGGGGGHAAAPGSVGCRGGGVAQWRQRRQSAAG